MSPFPPSLRHLLPRFLPDGLLERLHAGTGLAERREVVVLFVRFSGLSVLARNRPAEEVARVAERLLARCAEVAERQGGALDKFFGETALLVFGAPRFAEHAADRAVGAALEIASMEMEAGLPAPACALHRGLSIAGLLGSEERAAWTVIGDAVNSAHRLLGQTAPGEVVAGAPVLDALASGAGLRIEELPPLETKGKRLPLRRSRITRIADAPAASLVGREGELAAIGRLLEGGEGPGLLLLGPPGAGKSALLHAALGRARERKIPALLRSCGSAGPGAFLLRLFEEAGELRGVEALRAAHVPAAIHALARALLRLAPSAPFVFALDDLDELDPASHALVQRALPLLRRHGCILLAASREAAFEGLEILRLAPLSTDAARQLLAGLRPDLREDPERLDRLAAQAGGWPGALRDLVADATERALARIDAMEPPGAAFLTALAILGVAPAIAAGSTAGIGEAEQEAIVARGMRLGLLREEPSGLRLADPAVAAALIGRLVAADRRHLHRRAAAALANLGRAEEALRHDVLGGEANQACIAAAALASRRMNEGQPAVALDLARAGLERAAEEEVLPALVARLHILEARALRLLGRQGEAQEVLIRAGSTPGVSRVEPLVELAAVERERTNLDKASELLALARRAAGSSRAARARVAWGEALLAEARGDPPGAEAACREAESLSPDPLMRARCASIRGRLAMAAGDLQGAEALFAKAAGPLAHDVAERLELTCTMARVRAALGQRADAVATLGQVATVAERQRELRVAARARRLRAELLAADAPAEAEAEARAAVETALRTGYAGELAAACDTLARLLDALGREREATTLRRQAAELRRGERPVGP